MPKHIIEFTLPEDGPELQVAVASMDLWGALKAIEHELRSNRKYDKPDADTIENIRQILVDLRLPELP
jgi:hypothetical protein